MVRNTLKEIPLVLSFKNAEGGRRLRWFLENATKTTMNSVIGGLGVHPSRHGSGDRNYT